MSSVSADHEVRSRQTRLADGLAVLTLYWLLALAARLAVAAIFWFSGRAKV